jgi:murein DD-endopeptidase MepM/ murein hydrolase activator NlpD
MNERLTTPEESLEQHISRERGERAMPEQTMHRRNFVKRLAVGASCTLLLYAHTAEAAAIPRLAWPTTARSINLGFGDDWTKYAINCTNLKWKHAGIDIGAAKGSAVTAAEAGTVIIVQEAPQWKWWITIEHQDAKRNKYTTVYWHLDKPPVKPGQGVKRGQQIAQVADMGKNTHLHFGVRNAVYSNTANRGALPAKVCTGFPAFSESFQSPLGFLP